MTVVEEREEKIAELVFRKLAGAGLGRDPAACLIEIVDRLVEQDGADETAKSLRELADEILQDDGDDDGNADA